MPHFAKLDHNNVVIFVTVGRQEDDGKETELTARTGDVYKQTSYNTYGGIYYDNETRKMHDDQSRAFRKNFAGLGYTYDEVRDAFIPPKSFESWILNETSCLWEAPVAYPIDGKIYQWNEETKNWIISDGT